MAPGIVAKIGPLHRGALAVFGGGLYAVSQPEVGAWILAPVALVPLFVAARGRRASERFVLGWLYGGFAAVFVLEPVGVALASFFGWSSALGWVAAIALGQVFGAIPIGVATWLGGRGVSDWAPSLFLPAAAWVVCEWVRSNFMGGAAWGLFAYAFTPRPELAQLAAWGGSSLLSFALVCVNVSVARCIAAPSRSTTVPGLVAATLFAVAGIGSTSPPALRVVDSFPPDVTPGELRVAVIQGALPLAARRGVARTKADTRALARQSDVANADLIVWSESAYSLVLPENLEMLVAAFGAAGLPAPLLLGAPRSGGEGPPYNSALLVGGSGIEAWYDKFYLVPFAEIVPAPIARLADVPSPRQRGNRRRPLPVGSHFAGIAICYDVLFADLSRDQANAGATFLVNLSNDEWFGGTRGVAQHVAASVLRAIETARPMLRATNTGVTTAIDARGQKLLELPMDRPGRFLAIVTPARSRTPYSRFGDWVAWLSLAGLGFGGFGVLTRR